MSQSVGISPIRTPYGATEETLWVKEDFSLDRTQTILGLPPTFLASEEKSPNSKKYPAKKMKEKQSRLTVKVEWISIGGSPKQWIINLRLISHEPYSNRSASLKFPLKTFLEMNESQPPLTFCN